MPDENAPLTQIRFTTELCEFHQVHGTDLKKKQKEFAESLRNHFLGKVPVGSNMPPIGVGATDSVVPDVGTVVTGDILVFLGAEGDIIDQVCNAYHDPKFPNSYWERMTEESERKRREERAAREERANSYVGARLAAMRNPQPAAPVVDSSQPGVPQEDEEWRRRLAEDPESLL